MTSMVEKVQAALVAAIEAHPNSTWRDTDCGGDDVQIDGFINMKALARAAIAAMRVPTKPQRLAMQRALLDNYPEIYDSEVYTNGNMMQAIYLAAIDASLSPDQAEETSGPGVIVQRPDGTWPDDPHNQQPNSEARDE